MQIVAYKIIPDVSKNSISFSKNYRIFSTGEPLEQAIQITGFVDDIDLGSANSAYLIRKLRYSTDKANWSLWYSFTEDNLTNLNQNLEYLNAQLNENNKNQSASLEVNEAILEKDLDYLKGIISKLEVNITDSEYEYQKWDKDKIVSSELLDSHSSLISKKIILKSSFSKVRKNINSIFRRQVKQKLFEC